MSSGVSEYEIKLPAGLTYGRALEIIERLPAVDNKGHVGAIVTFFMTNEAVVMASNVGGPRITVAGCDEDVDETVKEIEAALEAAPDDLSVALALERELE